MANENKTKLPGGITKEQLDAWKRDNKEGVHTVKLVLSPEEKDEAGKVVKEEVSKTIYLADPFNNPSVIAQALTMQDKIERQNFVLDLIYLGGDKVKDNVKEQFWAARAAVGLIDLYQTETKKH